MKTTKVCQVEPLEKVKPNKGWIQYQCFNSALNKIELLCTLDGTNQDVVGRIVLAPIVVVEVDSEDTH